MKRLLHIIIFLFISLFILNISHAQNGLLVKNKTKGDAWMYEVGSKVTYIKFYEEEYTTAKLNAILDSSVVFGTDTVLLKKIAGVRKKSPWHTVAHVVGIPLMLIGSVIMGEGVAAMYSDPDSDAGTKILLTGAAVFAVGYTPWAFNKKDLMVGFGGDWTVEIYKSKPSE